VPFDFSCLLLPFVVVVVATTMCANYRKVWRQRNVPNKRCLQTFSAQCACVCVCVCVRHFVDWYWVMCLGRRKE